MHSSGGSDGYSLSKANCCNSFRRSLVKVMLVVMMVVL